MKTITYNEQTHRLVPVEPNNTALDWVDPGFGTRKEAWDRVHAATGGATWERWDVVRERHPGKIGDARTYAREAGAQKVQATQENKALRAALERSANHIEEITRLGGKYHGLHGAIVADSYAEAKAARDALAAPSTKPEPVEVEPVALPFAILSDELKDLQRFHECAMDDEGYDVPKERMKRLAEIGLLRRVTANYYEHTIFGLSVLNGDFSVAKPTEAPVGKITQRQCGNVPRVEWYGAYPERGSTLYTAPPDYEAVKKQRDELLAALDDKSDITSKALRRAFQLGQTYWQQADSEYHSQNTKADATYAKFSELVNETRAALTSVKGGSV